MQYHRNIAIFECAKACRERGRFAGDGRGFVDCNQKRVSRLDCESRGLRNEKRSKRGMKSSFELEASRRAPTLGRSTATRTAIKHSSTSLDLPSSTTSHGRGDALLTIVEQ